jgi:hypothetical protein
VASHGESTTADEFARRHRNNPISDDANLRGIRHQRLRELGHIEGQNLVTDYLNPETQAEGAREQLRN